MHIYLFVFLTLFLLHHSLSYSFYNILLNRIKHSEQISLQLSDKLYRQ